MEYHVRLDGTNVGSVSSVANPRECMRICQFNRRCKYWTHYIGGNTCYMRDADSIVGRQADSNYFSGPKYCDDTTYMGITNHFEGFSTSSELFIYLRRTMKV